METRCSWCGGTILANACVRCGRSLPRSQRLDMFGDGSVQYAFGVDDSLDEIPDDYGLVDGDFSDLDFDQSGGDDGE